MKVNVKIILDKAKINSLVSTSKRAIELTAEATKSDMVTSAVVPKDTGELERSGFVDKSKLNKGKASIVFDTPYARRLYWHPEFKFRRDKNINAQGKWMQSYKDGDKKEFVKDTFKEIYRMLGKGIIK